jgi:CheY-like chemotaxis protein
MPLKVLPFCANVPQRPRHVTTDQKSLPILIVDDDEPTQSLLRAVLRRCGYTSEVASNGREAMALLQANTYAAVILDMMMPEVGGHEVVAFLAATSNPVPVIVCSAAGPAALAGFDPAIVRAIVRKPFDVDQLIAAVSGIARE